MTDITSTTRPTPKRKKLPGLNKAKSLRMNAWGETALAQVHEFFLNYANAKLSNAIIFTLVLAEYRNYITRRVKAINRLEGEARENALKDLVYAEMAKVKFVRGRD
jgi:hypothetical protein